MSNIYYDIASRTNGDVYIGVVGPVRSGKSTFVKKFMEEIVIPNIKDKNVQQRAIDELPQSANGRTIMTTQPNFVPNEAVEVVFQDKTRASVRLIDCVGYLIDGVEGLQENGKERLVTTPWSQKPISFQKAAETGTEKVVKEHSTIAVVLTCDGTITDIPRGNYHNAEQRVVKELQEIGKPFVMVLNSKTPYEKDTVSLAQSLSEKYNVHCIPLDVSNATKEQLEQVISAILNEFSVRKIKVELPKWMRTLDKEHPLISNLIEKIKGVATKIEKIKQCSEVCLISEDQNLNSPIIVDRDMGKGIVTFSITSKEELFYKILSENADSEINDEFSLINFIKETSFAKYKYEKLKNALEMAESTGYGVVSPNVDELVLEEPEIVKQGAMFGIRLKASAPSLHIMKVDVASEVAPLVGTEQQSQYLLNEFETNPKSIWQTNMFGKSMSELACDGLNEKCISMPQEAQAKLVRTVSKIVNEGKGGLICLLL